VKIEASAPSNIALIKYMGKEPGVGNRPANSSLSYTLEHLRSFVTLEASDRDEWAPLEGFDPIELSQDGLNKFLSHFAHLRLEWGIEGRFKIRSANNFPSDCGLASSASSFAALTMAAYALAKKQKPELTISPENLSKISRLGSGSSCRSFFGPWAEWEGEGAHAFQSPMRLEHAVIVVDSARKSVSSSEAHRRINTSLLWVGRPERAQMRLTALKKALSERNWRVLYEVCWEEFWDMHALFETSKPSFGFMNRETLSVLDQLRGLWSKQNDGPLITMDAGANVHVLLRDDQVNDANDWLRDFKTIRSWS